MPSKSRKKIKGQARKAKAKNATKNSNILHVINAGAGSTTSTIQVPDNNDSLCYHGQAEKTPDVCVQFMTMFFQLYIEKAITTTAAANRTMPARVAAVNYALQLAHNKYPEAVNNNLDIVKRVIIGNGTSFLLGRRNGTHDLEISIGCAAALMHIDTYTPSSCVSAGLLDYRDANVWMRNLDIMNGCSRSLVKFFVNQIPCNCLDELYAKVRSTMSKMGVCANCKQRKIRTSMFVCTGCDRMQYCSKACQILHLSGHKKHCKILQRYDLAIGDREDRG